MNDQCEYGPPGQQCPADATTERDGQKLCDAHAAKWDAEDAAWRREASSLAKEFESLSDHLFWCSLTRHDAIARANELALALATLEVPTK